MTSEHEPADAGVESDAARSAPVSIAHRGVEELGGAASLFTRQRQDHARLDALLKQVHSTHQDQQQAVLTKTARLVFPHAFAEEAVIWPLVRRLLPDGAELTLQVEQEHQQINELWRDLERTPVDDPGRPGLLERITALLREDVRDEEDELLPRLHERLTPMQARLAGRSWALVRRTAPTRPHPVVSRRPPGNALAAVPLTALDRARDRLDVIGRRSGSRGGLLASYLSSRLALAADAVERFRPLTWGEDPRTSKKVT
jgi:hemerythrin superfamily protein